MPIYQISRTDIDRGNPIQGKCLEQKTWQTPSCNLSCHTIGEKPSYNVTGDRWCQEIVQSNDCSLCPGIL